MTPGVWIKPFVADASSAVVAAHPEWWRDRSEAAVPGFLMPASDERSLDLGNDAAVDWLRALMTRLRTDFHIGWLKHDFGPLALAS
jgi:alpha-galactosidase